MAMANVSTTGASLSVSMPFFPLEKRQIPLPSNGTKRAALHPEWSTQINFLAYVPPNGILFQRMGVEEYEKRLESLLVDVGTLLRLPHHKFWSQVVYDHTLRNYLNTFLKFCPKCWQQSDYNQSDSLLSSRHSQLVQKTFLVFLRLSTYKESDEGFMDPQFFSNLHIKYKWLDVFEMSHLCGIYYKRSPLLEKICGNIIKQNVSNFKSRFTVFSSLIVRTINMLNVRCGLYLISSDDLTEDFNPVNTLEVFQLLRIVNLTSDLTSSLYTFFDSVSATLDFLFHDSNDLLTKLVSFLECTVKPLFWAVAYVRDNDIKDHLNKVLKESASCLVLIFKLILEKYWPPKLDVNCWTDCVLFLNLFLSSKWTRMSFDIDPSIESLLDFMKKFCDRAENVGKVDIAELTTLRERFNTKLVHVKKSMRSVQDGNCSNDGFGNTNASLLAAKNDIKEMFPDVQDSIVVFYLKQENLSTERAANALFENSFQLPKGISFEDVERSCGLNDINFNGAEEEVLKPFDRNKKEELTDDLKQDIVSRYGFIQDLEDDVSNFDSVNSTWDSKMNRNISTFDSRPVDVPVFLQHSHSLIEYDDDYDDTYDGVAQVADSFLIEDVGFQVENPNWGPSKWQTGLAPKNYDWSEDEECEGNQNEFPDAKSNPVNSASINNSVKETQSKNVREPVSVKARESCPNQPKSFKSHRHTNFANETNNSQNFNNSHPPQSASGNRGFGGARPKQRSNHMSNGMTADEHQNEKARESKNEHSNPRRSVANHDAQTRHDNSVENRRVNDTQEGTSSLPANPNRFENDGRPKQGIGRGRGFIKRSSQNESEEHPRTKTSNPHNRKNMSARKNNYNAPNFW